MENCKVGDEVQLVSISGVRDGVVMEITPAQDGQPKQYWLLPAEEQKKFITCALVKFEDGSEESVELYCLEEKEDSIQREFRNTAIRVTALINEKLKVASEALREAVQLSEEHGIPFHSYISFLSQSYSPGNTKDKFPGVDSEFIEEFTNSYNEYDGWQHSAVC